MAKKKTDILNVEKERNKAFYMHTKTDIDPITGEVLTQTSYTIAKTSSEPDFIKVYYQTVLAFNGMTDIPVAFLLSLSKFIEFTNDGEPLFVTLNSRCKSVLCTDCSLSLSQINRIIKKAVDSGVLFKTEWRAVYEVNPFMIAKGKWDSIKSLQANFSYTDGKWERKITEKQNEDGDTDTLDGQMELSDTGLKTKKKAKKGA